MTDIDVKYTLVRGTEWLTESGQVITYALQILQRERSLNWFSRGLEMRIGHASSNSIDWMCMEVRLPVSLPTQTYKQEGWLES